jgi:membrane protein
VTSLSQLEGGPAAPRSYDHADQTPAHHNTVIHNVVDQNASTGELVSELSQLISRLIRDELRLGQLELQQKGKKAGVGVGLFGGAGLLALFGVGALVAAAILGLATVVAPWLAAVIVGAVILLFAGILALTGKKEVSAATPPIPEEAVSGVKSDVETVKEGLHR